MMNSIIICEGSTDYYLLQYYMREALGWKDDKKIQSGILKVEGQKSRNLIKRYLASRRYITKAKFDTYFSVRTPAEQFAERQQILKNVKWEQYSKIQKDFVRLSEI